MIYPGSWDLSSGKSNFASRTQQKSTKHSIKGKGQNGQHRKGSHRAEWGTESQTHGWDELTAQYWRVNISQDLKTVGPHLQAKGQPGDSQICILQWKASWSPWLEIGAGSCMKSRPCAFAQTPTWMEWTRGNDFGCVSMLTFAMKNQIATSLPSLISEYMRELSFLLFLTFSELLSVKSISQNVPHFLMLPELPGQTDRWHSLTLWHRAAHLLCSVPGLSTAIAERLQNWAQMIEVCTREGWSELPQNPSKEVSNIHELLLAGWSCLAPSQPITFHTWALLRRDLFLWKKSRPGRIAINTISSLEN